MINRFLIGALSLGLITLLSCRVDEHSQTPSLEVEDGRIISLGGGITEFLYELGVDSMIVAVDITSTYPENTKSKIQLGHVKSIQIEQLLSLEADRIFAYSGELKPELVDKLKSAGRKVHLFSPPKSLEDTFKLVEDISNIICRPSSKIPIINAIKEDLTDIQRIERIPSVLFIYARGPGNLMVAGEGTSVNEMIILSGARNAATGFEGFKPFNTESLLVANPDVLLLFDSGIESLEGTSGLLQIPGMAQTNAGKKQQIFTMDGALMTGMGPRIGQAASMLNRYLIDINQSKS